MKPLKIDATDRKILAILQREGRLPNTRLAERVGLSPPSILERVRKLEERGVIRGYAAQIEEDLLLTPTLAYPPVRVGELAPKAADLFGLAVLRTVGLAPVISGAWAAGISKATFPRSSETRSQNRR